MNRDGSRLRKTLNSIEATWRLGWLNLCLVLAGCAMLVNPPNQTTEAEYDLNGRIRIKTESSILRLDFYLIYRESVVELQLWGAFGLGRNKVILTPDRYLIEDKNGNWTELSPTSLPYDIPMSVWRIGPELGEWLRLRPSHLGHEDSLNGWSWHDVDLRVERTQVINNEKVCRRLSITTGEADMLVLCDRWRSFR